MKLNIYRTMTAILLTVLFTSAHGYAQESYEVRVRRYVAQYKDLAIQEQRRTGVPASIKLAQGVLETQAGASELCMGAYNHFGIKCKKEWKGQTYTYTDDRPDECFRKYGCVNDSYTDHSEYLRSQPRYAQLFTLQLTDYKGWAVGLKRCGYATSPTYTQQLIKIIETFNLQDYTLAGKVDAPVKVSYASYNDTPQVRKAEIVPEEDANTVDVTVEAPRYDNTPVTVNNDMNRFANESGSFHANGFKAFYGHKGDVLLEQAIKYKIRYAHLLELNDLPDAPLEADMLVYLEKKNTKGLNEKHMVKDGETMLQVSQLEAIQLRQLRLLNMLDVDEEPAVGTVLQLRQMTSRKPALRNKNAVAERVNFPVQVAPAVRQEPVQTTVHPVVKEELPREEQEPENVMVAKPDAVIKKEKEGAGENPQPIKEELPKKEPATSVAAAEKINEKIVSPVQPVAEQIIVPKPAIEQVKEEEIIKPIAATEPNTKPSFNIADEKAVEETVKVKEKKHGRGGKTDITEKEKPASEPVSEFDKLKAQLDKVVFAEETVKPAEEATPNTVKEAKSVEKEKSAAAKKEQSLSKEDKAATRDVKPVAKEAKTAAKGTTEYYVVKKGDTAFGIAKKYGISMKQLKEWNKVDFENIRSGQKLIIKK